MIENKSPYQDIIHLSRPLSPNRRKMTMIERGAQFAPFAALTGYDKAIKETARLTWDELFLDENQFEILNERILILQENLFNNPEVSITYFEKDSLKEGGKYLTVSNTIKKIDTFERVIVLQDKKRINIDTIIQIESKLFDSYE